MNTLLIILGIVVVLFVIFVVRILKTPDKKPTKSHSQSTTNHLTDELFARLVLNNGVFVVFVDDKADGLICGWHQKGDVQVTEDSVPCAALMVSAVNWLAKLYHRNPNLYKAILYRDSLHIDETLTSSQKKKYIDARFMKIHTDSDRIIDEAYSFVYRYSQFCQLIQEHGDEAIDYVIDTSNNGTKAKRLANKYPTVEYINPNDYQEDDFVNIFLADLLWNLPHQK